MSDLAYDVAEALERENSVGLVVGEDERKIIAETINNFREEVG